MDDIPAIDLLFGHNSDRLTLDAGGQPGDIIEEWCRDEYEFRERRRPYLTDHK